MKNYIKPQTKVFEVNPQSLLVSSIDMKYRCDKYCRIWHTCLDRQNGKTCYDKR